MCKIPLFTSCSSSIYLYVVFVLQFADNNYVFQMSRDTSELEPVHKKRRVEHNNDTIHDVSLLQLQTSSMLALLCIIRSLNPVHKSMKH